MIKTSLAVFEQISGDMMSLDWYKIDICPMRGLWPLGPITANKCKYLQFAAFLGHCDAKNYISVELHFEVALSISTVIFLRYS